MDPEQELAIKISEYFEFLWDGRLPVWNTEGRLRACTFQDLVPIAPGVPEGTLMPDRSSTLRSLLQSDDEVGIRGELHRFLSGAEGKDQKLRKPRLRRAAKTSGLWMTPSAEKGLDLEFADRYAVVCRPSENEGYLSPRRRYKPLDPMQQDLVLQELTECCSSVLARDLVNMHQIFGSSTIAIARPAAEGRAMLTIAALQFELCSFFFSAPHAVTLLARRLEYMPSFTARVATAVVNVRPHKGVFEQLDRWIYRGAENALSTQETGKPQEFATASASVRVSVALRKSKDPPRTGPELVRAVVGQIDKNAVARTTPTGPAESADIWFEVGICLLANPDWTTLVADYFGIPVPFGVALQEELDEVERSRNVRNGRPPDENPYA